jgi:hypothetical protein
MNIVRLVELLDACAATVAPFGETVSPGDRRWNGSEYVSVTERQLGDPHAKAWAVSFSTASGLLKHQDQVTIAQVHFLRKQFLGGMGSFNDFRLATERWGTAGGEANERLSRLRQQLHETLTSIEPSA